MSMELNHAIRAGLERRGLSRAWPGFGGSEAESTEQTFGPN
jgi:hypothetical protein